MPYQRQTREVFFKGRKAYDPSKQMRDESKLQDVEDSKFMKDMVAVGKDYDKALDQWNKNQALLDKEKVDFFKQVTPALTKLVGETVVSGLKIKRADERDEETKKWDLLDPAQKALITQQSEALVKRQDEIADKRADIATQARSLGLTEYAEYIDGLNKNRLETVTLNLMKEGLTGLRTQLSSALADESKRFSETINGQKVAFSGTEANTEARRKIVADTIRRDFLQLADVSGVNPNLLNATVGDKSKEIIDKWLFQKGTEALNQSANDNIVDRGNRLRTALFAYDGEKGLDPQNFKGKIATFIDQTTADYISKDDPNPRLRAKQDLADMLKTWYRAQTDKEGARLVITDILSGTGRDPVLVFHRGQNKNVPLYELDGARFGVQNFFNSAHRDSTGQPIPSAETLNVAAINKQKKDLGWTTDSDDLANIQQTIKYQWTERLKKGEEIPQGEIDNLVAIAVARGYDHSIIKEIARWPEGVYDAKETVRILKGLTSDGETEIKADDPRLDLMDNEALQKYLKDNNINLVENLYGEEDQGKAVLESDARLQKAVEGNLPPTPESEKVLQELQAEVRKRVLAKRYPEGDIPISQEIPEPPNEADLIRTITEEVRDEFLIDSKTEGHRYFRGEDGNYSSMLPQNLGWFGPAIKNRQKLEYQLQERTVTNLVRNNEDPNTPISSQKQILTRTQLLNISSGANNIHPRSGKVTYTGHLPKEFIKLALAAGENPWDFYNRQVELSNKNRGDKDVIPKLTQPESAQGWGFSNNELKELSSILDDGDGNYSYTRPNLTAARIINSKLNSHLQAQGMEPRPVETQLLNALTSQTGASSSYSSPDGTRLGKYNMHIDDIKALLSHKAVNLQWTNAQDFLNNPKLQEKIARIHIKRLTDKVWRGKPQKTYGRSKTEVRKNSALMVRGIFNNWLGTDSSDPETVYQNTLLLQEYTGLLNGNP